ncbi:hypothetical protein BGX29_004517, partial [Mortierella sp. GBA35]
AGRECSCSMQPLRDPQAQYKKTAVACIPAFSIASSSHFTSTRTALQHSSSSSTLPITSPPSPSSTMGQSASHDLVDYRIAPEWEPHNSTIMAWPTGWDALNPNVQQDIARVARAVAKFEYVQVLVPPRHVNEAKAMIADDKVGIISMPVDDLWARDIVPLFLSKGKDLVGVNYNFNGWGRKQPYKNDARVASSLLDHLDLPSFRSELVAEGGSIETDGDGTLMMTESSIINSNRNPGLSRNDIEEIFRAELGVKKIIWVKGVKGYDITDSHIDSLARFVAPGVVMISRPFPADKNDTESQADRQAQEIVKAAFPGREVVAVNIDFVAVGGGGIHCATHDIPMV